MKEGNLILIRCVCGMRVKACSSYFGIPLHLNSNGDYRVCPKWSGIPGKSA